MIPPLFSPLNQDRAIAPAPSILRMAASSMAGAETA